MDGIDVNLILQIVIIVLGLVAAYLAKKGLIDRKDFDRAKDIASSLAASVDKLKLDDPVAAAKLIEDILVRFGKDKPVLDEFLKKMNLNSPHKTGSG